MHHSYTILAIVVQKSRSIACIDSELYVHFVALVDNFFCLVAILVERRFIIKFLMLGSGCNNSAATFNKII